jgi:preprotein translocase subunit SecA
MLNLAGKLFLKFIGGSRNERIARSRLRFVREEVNPLEDRAGALSDDDLLKASLALKARRSRGESRSAVMAEALAMVREASRRARNHRQYDVQLVAGMVLDEGWIAEEATGEGKTIACYPAIYMAWLDGMKTHVVTTNDYLVQRDAEFARPVFALLGMTVGFIRSDMGTYGESAGPRRDAYRCDVTYGTNSELGFDYLRDNMKLSAADQVQGPLDFAIVDEVDNILIDEARTPLIISGPAHGDTDRYRKADAVAREIIERHRPHDRAQKRIDALKRQIKAFEGETDRQQDPKAARELEKARADLAAAETELARHMKYYEVERDRKAAHLTHEGISAAQEVAAVGSFYVGANMEWPHLMEQALRAHVIYEKDRDYVVQEGEVIIVDEFTGRLMQGRQWSDGLHQAVEAKERVRVKEETQTIATITIQNYFKLYKKLAGMTGTAMTEAGEFMKIYKLDAAAVPTHRPCNRVDHEDRIYSDIENKYKAIVEEVNTYSKMGRPVLVGTTSIEKSEKLSEMLVRTYGIEHQVLNARPENAAREADIVALAGQQRPLKREGKQMVGTVTIATNMAGRGTDIKLGPGVVWGNCKVPSDEQLARLGVKAESLFPGGSTKCCIFCPQYNPATNCSHCFKPRLDSEFPDRGRTKCREVVPCGLHIVGTERHEARRIDNQLRGRSGRQGDPGSSRFFLSLRDDLMAIFAGEWTVKVLGWLGLQGDVPIENRRISKGVERAQKKVEQRNFEMRKNLLEYDEVMDYQRHAFYSRRQSILEGRGVETIVPAMLRSAVDRAVQEYLDGQYARRCVAEWARQTLLVPLRDDQVHLAGPEDLLSLERDLRDRAKEEASSSVSMTIGEYMDPDVEPQDWDLRGLASWAMSRFGVNIPQSQLRNADPEQVERQLAEAAADRIEQMDLSELARFVEPDFPARALAAWAQAKFGIEVRAEDFFGPAGPEGGADRDTAHQALWSKVEAAYRRREIEYPIEHAIEMTVVAAGADNVYAATAMANWANRKFATSFAPDDFRDRKPEDIRKSLVELADQWHEPGKVEQVVRQALGSDPSAQAAAKFARERFDTTIADEELVTSADGAIERVAAAGRLFLRREFTELERFVLLQIYDSSWKDHLLAMDHLKSAIGLRGYAERDPRVEYKREGSRLFQEMIDGVTDKVTDMIFRVRLAPGAEMSNVYQISNQVHNQLSAYDDLARDMDDQRAAAAPQKVQQIVRQTPKVGRNDPCPCGSGKKYKKCHGKDAVD